MKNTALFKEHTKLNAKLVDFAGWQMPVQYEGILQEHKAVRDVVGIFDVSHMGEFFVEGPDASKFLDSIVPQDIDSLNIGKAVYCQLTNEEAGIIDDLLIYKIDSDKFLLIVNASRLKVDFEWIMKHKQGFDVQIQDKSQEYSLIALQGPYATKVIQKSGLTDLPPFMHIKKVTIYESEAFISRTGYTGEDGFEILTKNQNAQNIWQKLMTDGAEFNIKPVGLGARDTLRLEAALLLYGNDIDEKTTPLEAGLKWSIPQNKKANYIGKNKIMEQLNGATSKKLIGFKLLDRGIARDGATIIKDGNKIGTVTSGGFSPVDKVGFGLGYINDLNLKINDKIQIDVRGKEIPAIITKRPFITKSYVK